MTEIDRTYRLEVEGELGDMAGRSFPEMRILHRSGNTVLVGHIKTQTELSHVLQSCVDLGLPLVSVSLLSEGR